MNNSWGSEINPISPRPWRIGNKLVGGSRPLLMGILNVTPDSFFDGGKYVLLDKAIAHAEMMLAQGADIIDIGGESTRPGADTVDALEEAERVIPVIRELVKRCDIPISIDTVKESVAEAALDAGALIVNDISGMTFEPKMLDLVPIYGASVVINHIQGKPQDMQKQPQYEDLQKAVVDFLSEKVKLLAALGVEKSRIAVDPGIGFGKTLQNNYSLLNQLDTLDSLGCPILIGHSRKSFIVKTLGLEQSDRLIPSVATALWCALKGASILRVHDVEETRQALRIVEAIREGQ